MAEDNYSFLRTIAEILTGVLQFALGGALFIGLGSLYVAILPFSFIVDVIFMCALLPPPLLTLVFVLPAGLVALVGKLYEHIDAGFPNTRSVFSSKDNKDQKKENAALLVNEENTCTESQGLLSSQSSKKRQDEVPISARRDKRDTTRSTLSE